MAVSSEEQVAWESWSFQASCYPIPRVFQIYPATTVWEYTLPFLSFTPSQALNCCTGQGLTPRNFYLISPGWELGGSFAFQSE